jgi:hypothetical protein
MMSRRQKLAPFQREFIDEYKRETGGLCDICGGVPTGIGLCIDHDHETGMVRGLLCNGCNIGLGGFRDNPRLLIRAADYLRDPTLPLKFFPPNDPERARLAREKQREGTINAWKNPKFNMGRRKRVTSDDHTPRA